MSLKKEKYRHMHLQEFHVLTMSPILALKALRKLYKWVLYISIFFYLVLDYLQKERAIYR